MEQYNLCPLLIFLGFTGYRAIGSRFPPTDKTLINPSPLQAFPLCYRHLPLVYFFSFKDTLTSIHPVELSANVLSFKINLHKGHLHPKTYYFFSNIVASLTKDVLSCQHVLTIRQ